MKLVKLILSGTLVMMLAFSSPTYADKPDGSPGGGNGNGGGNNGGNGNGNGLDNPGKGGGKPSPNYK